MTLVDTEHATWLAREEQRLLDFAEAARHPGGGFGWLDDAGRIDPHQPRELWIAARMTHVFSCAHLRGRAGAAALADHGVAALRGAFRDDEHGGWWARIDADGPTTRAKTAYEHAFVVLAASSAVAADRPGAPALLDEALDVLLGRFWDPEHAMVVEEWDASWTTLDDYRGLNATMHTVEALLAAADVLGGPRGCELRDVAERIVTRVVRDLAPAHDWLLPEHFDLDGEPIPDFNLDQPAHPFRPYGATIGHSLEWARLTLHLAASRGPDAPAWMVAGAVSLADRAVEVGWSPDGGEGFVYTVDPGGTPVVRERMHWVAAEAIAAAAALHAATGDERWAERYRAWWEHVDAVFVDRQGGSWWHERSPDGGPSATVWSGKPDVYHAVQATWIPRLPLAPTLAAALRDGTGGG